MTPKYCPLCASPLQPALISGRERQKCSSATCDYVCWDNPTPVVAGLVEHNGSVVLVRSKGWPEKMYGIVAGFLEKDETPEEAALRETREELGLEGEIAGFIGYYTFREMNQLILAFHIQGEGELRLGEEVADVRLISPERLRPWPIGTGPAVRDWLERRKRVPPDLAGSAA
jgi:NADH pyrophosphatase NudC (nudix superfamily)